MPVNQVIRGSGRRIRWGRISNIKIPGSREKKSGITNSGLDKELGTKQRTAQEIGILKTRAKNI